MRKWRNWQTRTFEGRVVYTVRVQVPFSAPKKQVGISLPAFLLRKTLRKPQAARVRHTGDLLAGRVVSEANVVQVLDFLASV